MLRLGPAPQAPAPPAPTIPTSGSRIVHFRGPSKLGVSDVLRQTLGWTEFNSLKEQMQGGSVDVEGPTAEVLLDQKYPERPRAEKLSVRYDSKVHSLCKTYQGPRLGDSDGDFKQSEVLEKILEKIRQLEVDSSQDFSERNRSLKRNLISCIGQENVEALQAGSRKLKSREGSVEDWLKLVVEMLCFENFSDHFALLVALVPDPELKEKMRQGLKSMIHKSGGGRAMKALEKFKSESVSKHSTKHNNPPPKTILNPFTGKVSFLRAMLEVLVQQLGPWEGGAQGQCPLKVVTKLQAKVSQLDGVQCETLCELRHQLLEAVYDFRPDLTWFEADQLTSLRPLLFRLMHTPEDCPRAQAEVLLSKGWAEFRSTAVKVLLHRFVLDEQLWIYCYVRLASQRLASLGHLAEQHSARNDFPPLNPKPPPPVRVEPEAEFPALPSRPPGTLRPSQAKYSRGRRPDFGDMFDEALYPSLSNTSAPPPQPISAPSTSTRREGSGAVSAVADLFGAWKCPQCTFLNSSSKVRCDMCDGPKTSTVAGTGPENEDGGGWVKPRSRQGTTVLKTQHRRY